jgi:lipoprotein-releasing system permease protein
VYKLILCWRYLRTRFLAFVCIVSVMLGVATLVVVNAVMGGFSAKLKDRLHGLLSDIVIETPNYQGFPWTDDEMLRRIRQSSVGDQIEAMTPTIEVVAMVSFEVGSGQKDLGFMIRPNGPRVTRPVHLIGVEPKGRAAIGGFAEYLCDPARRNHPSFKLSDEALERFNILYPPAPDLPPEPPPGLPKEAILDEPPSAPRDPQGIIIGYAIGTYREKSKDPTKPAIERFVVQPGDVINVVTVGVGKSEISPVSSPFVVADYIKTEMAEYDGNFMYVPLDYLQQLRGSPGRSTHIQIKLKDYAHSKEVVDELRNIFDVECRYQGVQILRWEEKQGAILAAIDVERGLLNLLLFMIVGVAGFGILAIFSMIVVEKTRDIGIMKSLGASNFGVMSIFLGYGLLLGVVGAALGSILGLTITENINGIEKWLSQSTGHELFPRDVYYFDKIPTKIDAMNVALINVGAIAIAVIFSILPAIRAAMLNPVRALRYE